MARRPQHEEQKAPPTPAAATETATIIAPGEEHYDPETNEAREAMVTNPASPFANPGQSSSAVQDLPVREATLPNKFEVVHEKRVIIDGMPVVMARGRVLTDTTFDIPFLEKQGLDLRPVPPAPKE